MSEPLRLAGWGTLADGARITWTISEGRRGRRWREVVADGSAVRHALLLETASDGRFSHLELASAAGLWTFHPEGNGTLHGNHVDPAGAVVRHVAGWTFGDDAVLCIAGSPIGTAAVAWWLAPTIPENGRTVRAGVRLDPSGTSEPSDAIELVRVGPQGWRIGDGPLLEVDPRGVPVMIDGVETALEVGD